MKKETVKTFVIVVLVLLVVLLSIKTEKCHQEARKQPKTVFISDTLTNIVYDTLFIDHFEIVKLPTTDTLILINDSIRIDSVFVEVPISVSKLDTTFFTDSTSLNIHIQNSGYEVTLDSLSYYFEYTPRLQKKTHWFIGPSLGLGYDFATRKLVPTIGIGIGIATKRF